MLRRYERRLLEEIERQLRSEDPEFARRMTRVHPFTRIVAWLTFRRALGVVTAFLALLCLTFNESAGFLAAATLAGALFASAAWKIQTE
ncbi:DUF3040 domain-containing protein [Saccharopolyspora phatthalungensis]|uniref:DUF3040 domain-containing protein n=1 Tax=Saccharopolyspora phatthalungensis TaxID=664693 RepID=A0A840Q4V2_9PSEU|nr:DUF3040 domain-containing protein [Saccharopolyspora phatthalungensis]MBB5157532.1 hypothetical protein [Saccharopolyspora phatthalungensis]